MNWVGGSRSRLVMKNNAKKQREFFEKKKMQQKLKNLGIALPASTPGSSRSMDLVTLFVVNQIAADKESKDPPEVSVFGSCKESKHRRNKTLTLPMSPCSPSHLSLAESQPQYSVQGMGKRKHVISQGFKSRQLSPVLESAFSDNSASDYLPAIANSPSPFSTSSASSGQSGGIFPLNRQQRSQAQPQPPPHCSPPPWDFSGLELDNAFQPFSQPRGMTGNTPWSCGSNLPLYQLETPTPAQALFGSPEPDKTEVRECASQPGRFCLNQLEDREPMLDFMLKQSETEQQFEDDVFRGFSNDEYEGEGSAKSKIYLKDDSPVKPATPQTVPESKSMGVEHSDRSYTDFSGPGHNISPMNGCDYLSSYSCGTGYFSSDSNDGEERCQPHSHASASYIDQSCCADTPNLNSDPQEKSHQRHLQPRPVTPLIKPTMNLRDDQQVKENVRCQDKTCGSNSQQIESTALHLSPHFLAPAQICTLSKCTKTSSETQDAETQTIPMVGMCDASTQCDSLTKATGFSLFLAPVDMSVQHPATGRQTDTATELNTPTASSGNLQRVGRHTTWSKESDDSAKGSSFLNKFNNSYGKMILKSHTNPFLDGLSMTYGRGKQNGEARGQTGQQENGSVMKDHSGEVGEEATRVSRFSEEAETLQEIAHTLLLLKRKNKEQ